MADGINPAWKPLLDAIPKELHSLVIPTLQDWDKGVQQKFNDIRSEYSDVMEFAPFVENNIDPEYVQQAVMLADQLQRDPKTVLTQVNEAWNLGYVPAEEVAARSKDSDVYDFDGDTGTDDIFKNPKVLEMQKSLDEIRAQLAEEAELEEEEDEIAEFEEYLDELEEATTEAGLPFHRTFVTALIAQGLDGNEAVEQYQQVLNGSVQTEQSESSPPPVVMGSSGSTGSGSPDGSVQFSSLSKNDLTNTVEQLLARAAESGQ